MNSGPDSSLRRCRGPVSSFPGHDGARRAALPSCPNRLARRPDNGKGKKATGPPARPRVPGATDSTAQLRSLRPQTFRSTWPRDAEPRRSRAGHASRTPRAPGWNRAPPASPPRRSEDAPGKKAALKPGLQSKEAVLEDLGSLQAAMPGCPKSGCQVMPDSGSWRGSLGTVTSLRRICPQHQTRPVSSSNSPLLWWAPQDPASSSPSPGGSRVRSCTAVWGWGGGGPGLAISCPEGVGSLRQEPQKLELFLRGHRRAGNSSPRPSPGAQRGQ